MRYFSMFSGIGGFELGIQRSTGQKWECVGFSEIDKYSISTYLKNFPSHKNYGNAKDIDPAQLPDFDLLCGGFPCQAFSIAGKRMGFEDTRGTLFFDIARIAKVKRPQFLLLENVKGLLSHDRGRTFGTILATLDEMGYNAEWEVLNSKYFGVPQNRERVFIVGHLRSGSSRQIFPIGENDRYVIKTNKRELSTANIAGTLNDPSKNRGDGNYDIVPIEKDMEIKQVNQPKYSSNRVYSDEGIARRLRAEGGGKGGKTGLIIQSHSPRSGDPTKGGTGPLESSEHCFTIDSTPHNDIMRVQPVLTPNRPEKRQNGRRMKESGDPMFTLTGQDVHGVSMNNRIRRLTPVECERLQGFPDNWTSGVSDSQRYKQLGNAVTVNVIEEIVKKLDKSV